jgi:hypothetical protein
MGELSRLKKLILSIPDSQTLIITSAFSHKNAYPTTVLNFQKGPTLENIVIDPRDLARSLQRSISKNKHYEQREKNEGTRRPNATILGSYLGVIEEWMKSKGFSSPPRKRSNDELPTINKPSQELGKVWSRTRNETTVNKLIEKYFPVTQTPAN